MCLADAETHDENFDNMGSSIIDELRQQVTQHKQPHGLGRGYTVANLLWTIGFKATFLSRAGPLGSQRSNASHAQHMVGDHGTDVQKTTTLPFKGSRAALQA